MLKGRRKREQNWLLLSRGILGACQNTNTQILKSKGLKKYKSYKCKAKKENLILTENIKIN